MFFRFVIAIVFSFAFASAKPWLSIEVLKNQFLKVGYFLDKSIIFAIIHHANSGQKARFGRISGALGH